MKAIIGGTGVYGLAENIATKTVKTEYGAVSLDVLTIEGEEIVFLARHGKGHSVPPHLINYKANMKALEKLGVKYIFATVTVGSCDENIEVGDVVVIDDFLDFTKSRPTTYYEGTNKGGVVHTDMGDPYCSNLRKIFYNSFKEMGGTIKSDATYACTEGPRFETASEIKMYNILGGNVVGMTNVPEVVLAKELGMCYCAVGLVSNMCTGFVKENLAEHDISGNIEEAKTQVLKGFLKSFKLKLTQKDCECTDATMVM